MPTGIYIHVPFCAKKCTYCDFFSQDLGGETNPPISKDFDIYVRRIVSELKFSELGEIDTVYIGGGTPTVLPSFLLCEILEAVQELELTPNAEITVEANPGTVDLEYLAALKAHGVNRLSFGLQATQGRLLKTLGRIHTFEEFKENFRHARAVGFANISVDVMFALPGQTLDCWHDTLAEVIALSPEHISAYSLTPAEDTPLWAQLESGKLTLPDDKTDREMYHSARKILADAGFDHYEISNFAKRGYESRHNINCWTMKPYIGFGAGAHSFDGKARWESGGKKTNLHPNDLNSEKIILGLRLMRGVHESEFTPAFGKQIAKLKKDGLLASQQDRLFLTPTGMDFANRVFAEFI
ncbi:MAG: radical SAM family heme chaperone HemW [Defluviitaleaceae bacterium]|nr:radical SAM family heme chaperone HemW [Defluviitaleaceae bacterium]